jgi:hypothetical protein
MSCNLIDLGELALKPTSVNKQVSGRYLKLLEGVFYRNTIHPYTKYIGFQRCSAIASAVRVFPTPGLPLEIHVSTH